MTVCVAVEVKIQELVEEENEIEKEEEEVGGQCHCFKLSLRDMQTEVHRIEHGLKARATLFLQFKE